MRHPQLRNASVVWLVLVAQIPVLVVLTLVVSDRRPDLPALLPAILVASVGVVSSVTVVVLERLLATTAPRTVEEALHALQTRSLVQWAIGEAPLLLGVALAFALGPPWVVLVGALASAETLMRARPSRARIERLDRAWQEVGSPVRLADHLDGWSPPH